MTQIADLARRPYGEDDLDAVRTLHALAFEKLAAALHSPAQLAAHATMTRDAAYAADLAASHLMLALHRDGSLAATAGWIAVPDETDTARIRKVFVHPELARRGLASLMVRDAESRAQAQGYRRIVVRANHNAVPLYLRLGYRSLRQGSMAAAGVELPVTFMEKA